MRRMRSAAAEIGMANPKALGVDGDRRIDPDDIAGCVEQGPATVAGVDGCVGLDQAAERGLLACGLVGHGDLAVEPGDDAAGDGLRVAAEISGWPIAMAVQLDGDGVAD